MESEGKFVQEILALANITLNGDKPWDITVHDDHFYHRILKDAELGFGESYLDEQWDCAQLDELFYRIISFDLEKKALAHPKFWRSAIKQYLYEKSQGLFNYQTKARSFIVGEHHYDLGNDLYSAMLDKNMIYIALQKSLLGFKC